MGPPPFVPAPAIQIAQAVSLVGGQAWIVGGWVRDFLLGRPSKDLDIEVSGLSSQDLHQVLSDMGSVRKVGRSFPIFKFQHPQYDIDLSLPRKQCLPDGTLQLDPHIDLEESARGRDLTINAMALNPLNGDIEDPFAGQPDIEDQTLRAVDIHRFGEDPLRVVRVARFAAQLGFKVDDELQRCCRRIDISNVAPERTGGEIWKLFTAPHVTNGVRIADEINLWPQLIDDIEVTPSGPEMVGLKQWMSFRTELGSPVRAVTVALGILLHRTSKSGLENTLNRLDVYRKDGLDMRAELIWALSRWRDLSLRHDDAALKWASERGELAISLAIAQAINPDIDLTAAWHRTKELGILHCPLMPLVMGRDLIELGFSPGIRLGQALETIRAAQLDGRISTPEEAFQLAKKELNHLID